MTEASTVRIPKRSLRLDRKGLRLDVTENWPHLARTVAFVPDFLVTAWTELCDGFDDDAMDLWTQMRGRNCDSATDLVREFIAMATGQQSAA
jgi:hypothetical protein